MPTASHRIRRHFSIAASLAALVLVMIGTSCKSTREDNHHLMVVSVRNQSMALLHDGKLVASYPVSTSKYGLGDQRGSYRTPTGKMKVVQKFGDNAPVGAVFKSRRRTGEVLEPNAPGRDPIVSRILWLKGTQKHNKNAYSRFIYIHGTPEERNIGKACSYGCIRMTSHDVIDLYDRVGIGASLHVVGGKMPLGIRTQQVRRSISNVLSRADKDKKVAVTKPKDDKKEVASSDKPTPPAQGS